MPDSRAFYGPNAGYLADIYERYQKNPDSVDASSREFLNRNRVWVDTTLANGAVNLRMAPASVNVDVLVSAARLAEVIRERGHLAARVDPLGSDPPGDPQLSLEAHHLTPEDLESLPPGVVQAPPSRSASNALEGIRNLQAIYCSATGYDYEHVHNPEERAWLRDAAETERFRLHLAAADRKRLLERLTQVEAFEQFLHRTFPGEKRFSIQGADMLAPILDEAIHCQTRRGNRKVIMGMAHRGRLAVLAHVLQKPYSVVLAEFEHKARRRTGAPSEAGDEGWTGDVKYHLGAQWPEEIRTVLQVSITLVPNPSHLEFVNPVVEGMVRAAQDRLEKPGPPDQNLEAALAVLIHGDAAFPGEGIVAETLNLSRLAGYQTGGAIHLIVNNQIGFTTDPRDGRSTLYASDLAKGFEIPIVHVNADDPEACLAAARLACAYRDRFHKDFLIDLVCYRRWGHNEGDEPAFTQPRMYQTIRSHPTVRELWANQLEKIGNLNPGEAKQMLGAALDAVAREREKPAEESAGEQGADRESCGEPGRVRPECALPPVSDAALRSYNAALLELPEGFSLHQILQRVRDRRRSALAEDHQNGERAIDWGHAETLAFATILASGIPIRLAGQDAARATFSQRHLALHDSETGTTIIPLQTLPAARAAFAVYNSPLSENAALAFEYGYSVQCPTALVIWEAQFGDFANAAQVIIDQFITAARAKWRQTPGLVLLLPHGYEGQGPDHSSARLERFLQLAAEDNIRIANCSTAAQYYHLLRDQAALLADEPRPLIIMSPKRLLRFPGAGASLQELSGGRFHPVLHDSSPNPDQVTRLLLCSGKIYFEITGREDHPVPETIAVARIEELYPFPGEEVLQVIIKYPRLESVVWVQEEPENMGAWSYVAPRLRAMLAARGDGAQSDGSVRDIPIHYAGRPPRASPAEGLFELHAAEQDRIIAEALG